MTVAENISDEHDAKHGVRSVQEQQLAKDCHDNPGMSSYQQGNFGNANENPGMQ